MTESLRDALAAGDLEAARIANEAIARLLGGPMAGDGAVVDLERRRGGPR